MLTEDKSNQSERFLTAIAFISNERIKFMLNHIKHKSTDKESSISYDIYNDWHPKSNEILVYTTSAYADLEIPKTYICIFQRGNPDHHVISNFQITQAVLDLGGHWPCRMLNHGHKHFCVLTFDKSVPDIFNQLKELGRDWENTFDGLGLCDSTNFEYIRQNIISNQAKS